MLISIAIFATVLGRIQSQLIFPELQPFNKRLADLTTNHKIAYPFCDLKTLAGFGFQFTKVGTGQLMRDGC
ncbi:MAG: hypothetical protein DCF20_19260 [Pseudanabaena sp.]|nr:MAG: hypothetical protein DCF20_19260 [Pseudanabaena sp.]